ncbi:MAG: hypothetical protein EHM61_25640 [Acidobacteria bacterium]|nr:MAG: hypothetical protein EHM61_25640 [Acidobacteriota bacterium]
MRLDRPILVAALSALLPVLALSQTGPASVPAGDILFSQSSIEWPASAPDAPVILTVSGPGALFIKQEHPAGGWARFNLLNEQGRPQPDGVYKWELVVQAGWEVAAQVRSGWFEIRGGRVVAEGPGDTQAVVIEEKAPQNSLYVDSHGRVGVGTAVPGAQLHLKGTDPALAIEDTYAGGREYRLRSNQSGDGSLGLFEQTSGQARWLVDGEGRMGINTATPTSTLTVDGYVEATKGFLVNGRPLGGTGFGFLGSAQPLSMESSSSNYFGTGAGLSNTTGIFNSFFGAAAGLSNTEGHRNSFFGRDSGYYNTTGNNNSFFGNRAGYSTGTGYSNSFFGSLAGQANSTGIYNCFFGDSAGYFNTTGHSNAFYGLSAGSMNTTGYRNSFFGRSAGEHNTVEANNTFIGCYSDLAPGQDPSFNPVSNATAIGYRAYVARSNSLILGGVRGFNQVTTETFVGIGTPSPDRQLVVEGTQAIGKFRRYNSGGPDFAPAFLFERGRGTNISAYDILPGDYLGKVQFRGRVNGNMPEYGAFVFIASDTVQNGRFSFIDRDLATERMVVLNTGNVGIGTNAPTALLDVAGDLRVRGNLLYGAPATPVPDYVFEPEYELMPLDELGQYVKTEKHLPNVPKAIEIQEKGVNLGEFQMKLLEKIEQLTLYTVQQGQVIRRQKEEADGLRLKAASQEERIKALEDVVKRLAER